MNLLRSVLIQNHLQFPCFHVVIRAPFTDTNFLTKTKLSFQREILTVDRDRDYIEEEMASVLPIFIQFLRDNQLFRTEQILFEELSMYLFIYTHNSYIFKF
jgi:hypothetical protein